MRGAAGCDGPAGRATTGAGAPRSPSPLCPTQLRLVPTLHPSPQVAERIATSSIGFGNPVRARGTPGTIAAQSAALRQVRMLH